MPKKLKDLVLELGAIGLAVYLTTTVLVYVGFWIALQFGWRPESATGTAGYWIAAYVTVKATQIPRIAVTVAVTPLIARFYDRVAGKKAAARESPNRQPPAAPRAD